MIEVIAFDADDTLWFSETLYVGVQQEFKQLLSKYQPAEVVEEELHRTEMRNLELFGYGVKAFTLSMIETAIRLSEGQIEAREIQTIIDAARGMLTSPLRLFEHVEETLATLAGSHRLMLVTKGDLLDQEAKLANSGLVDTFDYVEIVSEKTPATYEAILETHGIDPQAFLMVGNSLRSDILPVLAIGGHAVYVPYEMTWAHEVVEHDASQNGYYELEHIGQLPRLVGELQTE